MRRFLPLALSFLLAFGLDLCLIYRKPLEYDEALTWHLARADFKTLCSCDIEPPGFYLWAKPFRPLLKNPASLRLPQALFSALWVVPAWFVAEAVGGREVATFSTLFLALHPLRLRLGQYARSDALAALLDLLSLWALIALLCRPGTGRLLLFALLSNLTWFFYLPFTPALLARTFGLMIFIFERRARLPLVASAFSVCLFLCWSLTHVAQHAPVSSPSLAWGVGGLLLGVTEPSTAFLTALWRTPFEGWALPLGLLLSLAALYGAFLLWRKPEGMAVAISWLGVMGINSLLCASGAMPPQQGYFTVAVAPFLVCLGMAWAKLRGPLRWPLPTLLLILPLGCVLHLRRPCGTADFLSPARFILRHFRKGDGVFCQPPGADIPMRLYLGPRVPMEPHPPTIWTRAGYFVGLPARRLTRSDWEGAKRRALRFKRLWLVEWHYSPAVPLRWKHWPEAKGYKLALRRGFMGYTQRVYVNLYLPAKPRKLPSRRQ